MLKPYTVGYLITPPPFFPSGIFSFWHFFLWHFFPLAFFPMAFFPSGISSYGIFSSGIFAVIQPNTLSAWKKGKEKIMKDFEEYGSRKRQRVKCGTYEQVNKACHKWFLQMRAKNVPVSGLIILEKSQDFATQLRVENFQASHGWLF